MQVIGQRLRRGITVGLLFGAAACLVNWLFEGETSPLYRYFLYHVGLPNFWGRLNFPAYAAVVVLGRGPFSDGIYYVVIFMQWAVVALLVSLLLPVRNLKLK